MKKEKVQKFSFIYFFLYQEKSQQISFTWFRGKKGRKKNIIKRFMAWFGKKKVSQ